MPIATKVYTFAADLQGFASLFGTFAWKSDDGSDFTPASAPGCLRQHGTTADGGIIGDGLETGSAAAILSGVTWEAMGVPAGQQAISLSISFMARRITGTNAKSASLYVSPLVAGSTTVEGGVAIDGTPVITNGLPGGNAYAYPPGVGCDLYYSPSPNYPVDGAWHSTAELESNIGAIMSPPMTGTKFTVDPAYAASSTALDLVLLFRYLTGYPSGPAPSTLDVDWLVDSLTFSIEYGILFSDALTLSDNLSFSLRATGAPPPAGTGQPPRYSDGDFLDSCDPTSTAPTVCTWVQRSIPPALAAHLQGEALTLAYCLRLARRDGAVLGFTTHDDDLTWDPGDGEVTFEALNSVSVTALRQELGGSVASMDLAGLIRSDRVTTADLLAGRYDGAELTLFLVNWASLGDGALTLARGSWGAVTVIDGQWRAEYRSLSQRLQQQIVELTSATCRVVQLGDSRCKVNLAPFQFSRAVTAVVDNRNFTFGADSHASGYFAAGRVIWTSGANDGLSQEIKRNTPSGGAQGIELQLAAPFPVSVGDIATLEAGCDRRLATCRDRFNNTINFRGEPTVPGSEVLRRIQSLEVVG